MTAKLNEMVHLCVDRRMRCEALGCEGFQVFGIVCGGGIWLVELVLLLTIWLFLSFSCVHLSNRMLFIYHRVLLKNMNMYSRRQSNPAYFITFNLSILV